MHNYFKNITDKNSCNFSGVCAIHPTISAMYDILISLIRETSFYIVKMKEFGFTNKTILNQIIEALSIFIINTTISHDKYLEFIRNINDIKNRAKEKYLSYCKNQNLPCETINSYCQINNDTNISELIELAEANSFNRQKQFDQTKQRLFELITIFAKVCAINVCKIKKFMPDFDEFDYEILRFFALTNGYSIRNEKIIRRIKLFSKTALQIRKKYYEILDERYGTKQDATISTSEFKGSALLISGDDFDELEKILKEIEKENIENLWVYTNGPLFLAHFYPYFQNNKYLKGHWGSDDAYYDFSNFKGSILITRNFLQKIDSLYKGDIFSNKLISYTNVKNIVNSDYTPLLNCAKEHITFKHDTLKETLNIKYNKSKIEKFVQNFDQKEIVLVAGYLENKNMLDVYKNKTILNFNCPLELELLLNSIETLRAKDIKITVLFAQCNAQSFALALSLLDLDLDIYIANCSHILINPHVFEALKENFSFKLI